MDVTQTQSAPAQPLFSGPNAQTQDGPAKTTLSSDFETFLRMLTVQMENQDPLNPIDSADYAVQLATFSSVEQQVLTNDLLSALSNTMAGGGLGTLGQWVGMDARGSNKAHFSGSPIELSVPEFGDADRKQLVISNEAGQTMARIDLNLAAQDVTWDGTLSTGATAPNGVYSFRIEAYKSGQLIATEEAASYARVREARLSPDGPELVLDGDIVVKSAGITALRAPKTDAGR